MRTSVPPELISTTWGGRFRGQKQKWFALRFTGTDDDIDLNAAQHPEFSDWRWVETGAVIDLIIPFKRDVYKSVMAEFHDWAAA